ncbi:protein PML isoform X2 [Sorex araneus]|uniref:protein PML isoform X2 n=1 Tax=Sorex araneus TaxID=42254 RepID=UPI002433B2DD|nr:protein PML isoform X2 [Sorex araneus]
MSRPESPVEDRTRSSSPSPRLAEQLTSEEFQFLRCQDCQAEAKCPKLLPCLHSLCSGCLEPPDLQCPICKVPRPLDTDPPVLDNVFFESLQRHLSLHRQVMDERATCTRCKNSADFWCSQCEKLYCPKCYETHGYFLKHEAQRLEEIRSQPVLQFLDSMRKTNNIFCSHHSRHPDPMLTSIYCRGCARALCCSCAILDSDAHKDLKCDIRLEIEQRQGELDSMKQVLQAREVAFGAAQAEVQTAVSQLDRERANMEELVRSRISQVLMRVRAQERELLEAVNQHYQRDYGELAGRLQRLDATLQRIRTGSVLVQKMRRYASDQEVLDMHGFLRQALHHLSQEEPRSAGAAVRVDGFEEVKARLQDLVSGITQGTDLPVPERASPPPASTPETSSDIGLGVEVQAPGPAEAQPEAVVQPMPGAHPVPVNAYSIRDCVCRENNPLEATPQKRKACQTESPRKMVKLQSPEREARLEPGPSTSQVASPPRWDEPGSPKGPHVEDEDSTPHINHLANSHKEAGDCIVINSSEESDTENSRPDHAPVQGQRHLNGDSGPPPARSLELSIGKHAGAAETSAASSSLADLLLPIPSAAPPDTPTPPTSLPPQPAQQDSENCGQPAGPPEQVPGQQGRGFPSGGRIRMSRLLFRRGFHNLPLACAPTRACQPTPSQQASPEDFTPHRPAGRARRPAPARSRPSLRGRSRVTRWLNAFFALPLSTVTAQLNPAASRALEDQGARPAAATAPRQNAQGVLPHTFPPPH